MVVTVKNEVTKKSIAASCHPDSLQASDLEVSQPIHNLCLGPKDNEVISIPTKALQVRHCSFSQTNKQTNQVTGGQQAGLCLVSIDSKGRRR